MSMRLDEVLAQLKEMPAAQRTRLETQALDDTARLRWVPNPGPQMEAYLSEADELYYGGEAGGGKSDLLLGLAINCHQRAVIFREVKDDARELGQRLCSILGSTAGYNDQMARWRSGKQEIAFEGMPNEEDKQRHKGRPRDLHGFDEIPDFTETQYEFVIAWNRSSEPGQRSRVVCTGNPPTRAKGLWVIRRWAAWLDPRHPNPAADGELRWYLRGEDGQELEVDGPGPYDIDGKPTRAKSRTFIRAHLSDNPDLARTDYDATLARLPKELRDAYREGKFDIALQDHPFQVIPTAWVLAAQKRWTPRPPPGIPMCGMGVDPANGGRDRFTISTRYDHWFAPFVCIPGLEIKLQSQGAGHVIANRRDGADVMVDMGGGYGGGTYERLSENRIEVQTHMGSKKATTRTADRKLGFANKRAEVYWRLREALDPDQPGGSPLALPPDPELVSDLTVLTYEVRRTLITVLDKVDVVKALGRSPDKGDALTLCWAVGPRGLVPHVSAGDFGPEQYIAPAEMRRNVRPKVDLGTRYNNRSRH